jgi:nicotinamide mononucleotide adenylyltransferase
MSEPPDVFYDVACVIGRFQPPHNDHLNYIQLAMKKCAFLWVGISQPYNHRLAPSPHASHRAEASANPLTYFERQEILTQALLDSGYQRSGFSCTPFPLDETEELYGFMPVTIPCLITITEPWGFHKAELLRSLGYSVVVLYEAPVKAISGRGIREGIMADRADWEQLVPAATAKAVRDLAIRKRLLNLGAQEESS